VIRHEIFQSFLKGLIELPMMHRSYLFVDKWPTLEGEENKWQLAARGGHTELKNSSALAPEKRIS
jgi:hypothetical protein